MELRLVSRPEDFAALHSAWNVLHRRTRRPSPFLTHEWFDAAWQWRRRGAELYILCCMRGQDLVGVMPLLRPTASARSAAVRELEFLAVPDTQVCDVLAAETDRLPVASALADELVRRQRDWDAIALRYLPDATVALTELRQALSHRGLRCDVRQATRNPWIALDSPWETYYASRSRRLKKAINLASNRLSKAGDIELRWLQPGEGDADEADHQVDQITAISARSWKTSTGNSLDNAGPQAFVRRLAQHAHRMNCLSVWTLTLNKVPIAMELQLIDDGCVFALRSDFDAAYESISPGSYLNRHMLARLFGTGLRRYLMGPGENIYKYRWADDSEAVSTMTIYGHSMRGRWLATRELALKPAARRIRDLFRRARSESPEAPNPDDAT